MSLKVLRTIYHSIKDNRVKAFSLSALEKIGVRKDIVRLDLNDVCNIECIMCCNKPGKCTAEHVMALHEFERVLDAVGGRARLLYLSCSYEPLMTPRFEDYLAAAAHRKIPFISFATNALLLKEEIARAAVDHQVHEIIFSFNGYLKDDYNRIMYRSNYDVVMKNLEKLRDYKREKNSKLPRIRVNTILMKTNLENIDAFVRFLKDYDVDHVQFRKFDDHEVNDPAAVKAEELDGEAVAGMKPQLDRLKAEVRRLAQEGKEIIIPLGLDDDRKLAEKKRKGSGGSCPIPFFSYWIRFNGEVRVCCGENEGALIGNILTEPFSALVNKKKKFRKMALSGACRGNCASTNFFESTIL
jgi:MoaA/NifB/PqqE/SkfB family radical SAM enzyme